MEANVCDINRLDADVLLPPRKRLLAGFKKQCLNAASAADDGSKSPPVVAFSSFLATPSTPSPSSPTLHSPLTPPSPVPCSPSSNEFQTRLDNLMSSYFGNNYNVSPEMIVAASKTVADTAVNAAKAARVAAEEKAVIAARAVAAAKSALALVASFPEETDAKDRHLKKNKLKKHVQLQLLYKKHEPIENYSNGEGLDRKPHRVMNSSPTISINSAVSNSEGHKRKKPKTSRNSDKTRNFDGESSPINGHAVVPSELGTEDSVKETYTSTVDKKLTKYKKGIQVQIENGEAESSYVRKRSWIEIDTNSPGKRRGKLKLKKLPLSICNFKDSTSTKDDSSLTLSNTGNSTSCNKPLLPEDHCRVPSFASVEAPRMWKCQVFKAPEYVKLSKVMQS